MARTTEVVLSERTARSAPLSSKSLNGASEFQAFFSAVFIDSIKGVSMGRYPWRESRAFTVATTCSRISASSGRMSLKPRGVVAMRFSHHICLASSVRTL